MSIDPKLLHILRCPVTKQKLTAVSDEDLNILNQRISEDALQHIDGSLVSEPLTAALTTENRHTIYKVVNGIPVMLENESIPAEQLDNW